MEANQLYQFRSKLRAVYNPATTALVRGYAVCYDPTSTEVAAVTTEDKARGKYVVAPTAAISRYFAGVTTCAKTTTQAKNFVDIITPGSDGMIYVTESVTAGQIVYFNAGGTLVGQFSLGGMGLGRGAAVVHTTITEAGYAHATLLEGPQTGGVMTLAPTTGAIVPSLEGMTIVDGTSVSGGLTYTLADGTFVGQRKGFKIGVLLAGSNDLVITVTNGVQLDGSTALATVTLDELADQSILEWDGINWKLIANSGGALA